MIARLTLGADHWSLTSTTADLQLDVNLPISVSAVVDQVLRHSPPTAHEVEQAIALIEDAIMPRATSLPPGLQVQSADPRVRAVVQSVAFMRVGAADVTVYADDMERCFSRFASMVFGSSPAHEAIPPDGDFAATLLILRECLHHLRWASITTIGGRG